MTEDERVQQLKKQHEKLQLYLSDNQIGIREGIVLDISDKSMFPFEFFCWRSPNCYNELSYFVGEAKGKKLLLDVGAHHGLFSMVFASINPSGEAFAFEPSQLPYEILCENIKGNERIYSASVALSDKKGELPMSREWDHLVMDKSKSPLYYIQCIQGDDFFDSETFPDVIKIDVEGMELRVLKGLNRIISQAHPIIFLEFHPSRIVNYGDSIKELCDLLVKWGYKAFDTFTEKEISFQEINDFRDGDLRLLLT